MRVACILLAAGLGSRMGGDKLARVLNGRTLIERATALAAGLPFSQRVAVVRPGDDAVIETVTRSGLTPVYNPDAARGIASSLNIGLSAVMEKNPEGALFMVADQPWLRPGTVEAMLDFFKAEPGAIVRPRTADGRMGNPVLFPQSLFPELNELMGDTGGKAVIKKHPELVRFVLCEEKELRDMDTPEDMRA